MNRDTPSNEQQATRRRVAALIDSGASSEAEALAHQELEAAPEDPFWLYVLGYLARQRGDFEAARGLLQRSIDQGPEHSQAQDELGMTCRTMGNSADALRAFQQAIRIDAGHIPPYLHLAGLFHDMGRTDDARFCLLRARDRPGQRRNPQTSGPHVSSGRRAGGGDAGLWLGIVT